MIGRGASGSVRLVQVCVCVGVLGFAKSAYECRPKMDSPNCVQVPTSRADSSLRESGTRMPSNV